MQRKLRVGDRLQGKYTGSKLTVVEGKNGSVALLYDGDPRDHAFTPEPRHLKDYILLESAPKEPDKTVFFYLRDHDGHPIGVLMLERLTDTSRGDFAVSASLCAKTDQWDRHEGQRLAQFRLEHQVGPLWRAGQLMSFGVFNLLKMLLKEHTARIRDVDTHRARKTLGHQVNRLMGEDYFQRWDIDEYTVVEAIRHHHVHDFPWKWYRFVMGKEVDTGWSRSLTDCLFHAGFWAGMEKSRNDQ